MTINHNINTPNPSSFSVFGSKLRITGSGFPSAWPNKYYNKIALITGKISLPLDVVSMNPTEIVLNLPPTSLSTVRSFTFSITNSMGTSKSITFSQSASSTPGVELLSSASISSNVATNIILRRTTLNTTYPEKIQLYSVTNPNYVYDVATWTNSSVNLTFSVTLNSGKYGFKLFDDVYG